MRKDCQGINMYTYTIVHQVLLKCYILLYAIYNDNLDTGYY